MDYNLQKKYESQIILLDTQNNTLKQDNLNIKGSYQQLSKKLNQNRLIQVEQQHQIKQLQNQYKQLKNQKNNILAKFINKQADYKALSDYIYIQNGFSSDQNYWKYYKDTILQQVKLTNNANKIVFEQNQQHIKVLKAAIKHKNNSIQQFIKENIKLKSSIFECTTHYQTEIMKLKEEIIKLKNSPIIKEKIEVRQQHRRDNQKDKLNLQIKNLKQYLNLKNGQIQDKQKTIDFLNKKQIIQKKQVKNYQNIENIDQMITIIQKKQQLQITNIRLQQQLLNIKQQFPRLLQNQQKIKQFLQKYKKYYQRQKLIYQKDNKIKQLQYQLTQRKIKKYQYQNQQIQIKLALQQKNQQLLLTVINLKKIISRIDPLFPIYRFGAYGILSQQEIQIVQRNIQNQVSDVIQLKRQIQRQKIIINQQINRIQNLQNFVKQRDLLIEQNMLTIDSLNNTLNSKIINDVGQYKLSMSNSKLKVYQQLIQQLKTQRQNLTTIIRQKQKQNAILCSQRDYYKTYQQKNLIVLNQIQNPIVDFNSINVNIIQYKQNHKQLLNQFNKISKNFKIILQFNLKNQQKLLQKNQQQYLQNNKIIQRLQHKNKFLQMENQLKSQKLLKQQGKQQQKKKNYQIDFSNSFMEIQDNINQQSQLPLNTVTIQSINYLKQLLNNHQNLLKNVLKQFDKYKKQCQSKILNKQSYNLDVNLNEKLIEKQKQLKSCLIRLNQADFNLKNMENQLERVQQQSNELKDFYQTKISQLTKEIENHQQQKQVISKKLENIENKIIEIAHTTSLDQFTSIKQTAITTLLVLINNKNQQINKLNKNLVIAQKQIDNLIDQESRGQKSKSPLENKSIIQLKKMLEQGILNETVKQIKDSLQKHKE